MITYPLWDYLLPCVPCIPTARIPFFFPTLFMSPTNNWLIVQDCNRRIKSGWVINWLFRFPSWRLKSDWLINWLFRIPKLTQNSIYHEPHSITDSRIINSPPEVIFNLNHQIFEALISGLICWRKRLLLFLRGYFKYESNKKKPYP